MTSTERWNRAIRDLKAWGPTATMERATGSVFNNLLAAWAQGDLVWSPDPAFPQQQQEAWYEFLNRPYQIFVVEHDWAAAFDGAEETGQGVEIGSIASGRPSIFFDTRMPYPDCCFEFQFSGRRICLLVNFDGQNYTFHGLMRTTAGWSGMRLAENPDSAAASLKMQKSVRAILIALDAEVAQTQTVSIPHKQTKAQRSRGVDPVSEYHVVKLSGRTTARSSPAITSEPVRGVRLHFRRGHWRHFETHKTWIKWTLVGDPDLGFIDKHYRL